MTLTRRNALRLLAGASALPAGHAMAGPAPLSAGLVRALAIGLPPIEAFGTLAGNGVTDDSTALKAAHDAAFAAGFREVYAARQYYAPTAYNLGNVIFRGPGALIGTYRKRVIPFSARAILPLPSNVIPARDLRRAAKALKPTVLIWGDSTGTYAANRVSPAELLWVLIERAFLRDNPGRSFNFVNRSIGGTDVTQYSLTGTALQAAGVTLPSWFTNAASPWSGYIANQTPDLIIINWGANNGGACTPATIAAVVNYILTLPKIPDILFCTNNPRGTQADAGSAMQTALEQRDFAAGAVRAFAEFNGYGFFDIHRAGCMMRDGFDPAAQTNTQLIGAATTLALPATLAMTGGDLDLAFQIDNTGGQAFGAAQTLDIALSALGGNLLRLSNSGGFYRYIGYSGSGGTWASVTTTAVAMPTGLCTIEIATRGAMISIYFETVLVYEGLFLRAGGQFQPTVAYTSGSSGATSISVTTYVASSPTTCDPVLTDAEMFGASQVAANPNGGNGVNHPGSAAYENIHAIVLNAAQLALPAAGRLVQTITAAAAVNADAALVELTGPATGSYAVTLAAPRTQDQGNMLAIEMASTTSTNSVTLALTNVAGGTASTTCTWNAAGQRLLLQAMASKWEVVKQDGVTLS